MAGYQFERECRTPQSESYIVELDEEEVGRIDIHYTNSVAYATLCVPESLTSEDIRELIRLMVEADVKNLETALNGGREAIRRAALVAS